MKLIKFLAPYKIIVAIALALLFGQAIAELYLPYLMTEIVDIGIIGQDPAHIRYVGMRMVFIAFLSGLASIAAGYFVPKIAAGFARDLRRALFVKIEGFSQHEFDRFSSASLITRTTNDVNQVQTAINLAGRMLCYASLMGIGGIVMAVNQSVEMSWIIALAVVVLLGLVVLVSTIALRRFKILQKLMDKLNLVSREALAGLMVVKAFGRREREEARFDTVNRDLMEHGLVVVRVMAVALPALTFIMNGTAILVVWAGSHYVAAGELQLGDMMAFMQYSMRIIISFMMLSMMMIFVPRAAVSAERILEVFDAEESVKDPENPKVFVGTRRAVSGDAMTVSETPGHGTPCPYETRPATVEFRSVTFRYHNAEAATLSDLSFTVNPGETTAIIGATGAGKTTIAQLLLRFYDVTEGAILMDGIDIREVKQADLRKRIGYVPQKSRLLKGTIASNIRYGREDATDEELKEFARVAQALDFIEEKPEGFDAEIVQAGTNISGGQRQRLSIARALAKRPSVLLFDDSFSALDFKTDAELRKALAAHTAHTAVIVIAQRVGTIMSAGQILVLEKGKIVGRGTHSELLKTCPEYHEIASSQFTEEQLAKM